MTHRNVPRAVFRGRGTSLLEAVVALLFLTLGMLVLARVQVQARLHADFGRHQAEAMRLAQSELEGLRAVPDFHPTTRQVDTDDSDGTRYRLDRRVDRDVVPGAHAVTVEVAWSERDGSPRSAVLHTLLAEAEPAHSGAAGLARSRDSGP